MDSIHSIEVHSDSHLNILFPGVILAVKINGKPAMIGLRQAGFIREDGTIYVEFYNAASLRGLETDHFAGIIVRKAQLAA